MSSLFSVNKMTDLGIEDEIFNLYPVSEKSFKADGGYRVYSNDNWSRSVRSVCGAIPCCLTCRWVCMGGDHFTNYLEGTWCCCLN